MFRSILFLCCFPTVTFSQTPLDSKLAFFDSNDATAWYDISHLDLEGQGWKDVKSTYDRFPKKAEKIVPPSVWALSHHSAGMAVRFSTDASTVQLRWSLTSDQLAMAHMPATGVSGLDLYVRRDSNKPWLWAGVGQPLKKDGNTASITLFAGQKECLLYLPLYNGVTKVEVGIPKGATIAKGPSRPPEFTKPILFYGTSITQGGCASRPGMVHTAILGRRFERPVLNFGFSGSGRMDEGVVKLLAELDPAVFIIDCLPNMLEKEIGERTIPLVTMLRNARPETPILLVEDRNYTNNLVNEALLKRNRTSQAMLKRQYDRLTEMKIVGVHYLTGDKLLGDDREDTVDGSHPTDLGFMRHADAFEKALAGIISKPAKSK